MCGFERTGQAWTTCPGTSASFNVSATGTGLGYQWYKGGKRSDRSNQQQPGIERCDRSRCGQYSVVVSGVCGNPVTNSASLTVNQNVAVSERAAKCDDLSWNQCQLQRIGDGNRPWLSVVPGQQHFDRPDHTSLLLTNVTAAECG